jgi:hypothetical protein
MLFQVRVVKVAMIVNPIPGRRNLKMKHGTRSSSMAASSGDGRRESSKELDTKKPYTLFMSQPAGTTKLPSVPEDWGEREQQAVEKTIAHIRIPRVAREIFGVEESNLDDIDDSVKVSSPDPMEEYEAFVRALPLCVPMTIGFHAEDGESKC